MKGKEKAPKKEPERMISAGGVMNEWMNEWMSPRPKKKISSAKALSFIPFNMLLICSMIVTCPNKPSLCVCVCVWKERRGIMMTWVSSCLGVCFVRIPFSIASRGFSTTTSEFHAREKVSICSFLSPARIQNYMQLIAHFHGQHYSSLLSYWFVHMNEEGGVKDGIIPLPCPSLITGVSFLFFLGDINLFVKVNKIKNQN